MLSNFLSSFLCPLVLCTTQYRPITFETYHPRACVHCSFNIAMAYVTRLCTCVHARSSQVCLAVYLGCEYVGVTLYLQRLVWEIGRTTEPQNLSMWICICGLYWVYSSEPHSGMECRPRSIVCDLSLNLLFQLSFPPPLTRAQSQH